jgi:hypothetical protein
MFRMNNITKLLRQISFIRAGYGAKLLVTRGALQVTLKTVGKKCSAIQHPWTFSVASERSRLPREIIGLNSARATHRARSDGRAPIS